MIFHVLTLFPEIFSSFLGESLMAKALAKKITSVRLINPRDFTTDKHRTADDRPYGGGPGMLLKPEPLAAAIESVTSHPWRVFLSPSGARLNQAKVRELAARPELLLVCGRYEGVDQRVIDLFIDEEISIGDYVVNGGEVPAMILMEAVARLVPGFMGKGESADEESHADGLLECPHYTRPPVFRDLAVPEILLGGHHADVARWRLREAMVRTMLERPDLMAAADLGPEALALLSRPPAATSVRKKGGG